MNSLTYAEALELLEGGQLTHSPEDILKYSTDEEYLIDSRTTHNIQPGLGEVQPLGKTFNGYWLYICPDCGKVHAIHQKRLYGKKSIVCGCANTRYKRAVIGSDGITWIPAKRIHLVKLS